jgi:hypothetical protein
MKSRLIRMVLAALLLNSSVAFSAEEVPSAERTFHYFPEAVTLFPTVAGIGAGASYREHFQVGVLYGVTPSAYSDAIAGIAADLSGKPSYKDVIQAAFQNNSLWRFSFQYNFISTVKGWRVGVAASTLSSSGNAGIDQVLAAATGGDYTALKTFLIASGRSTTVDMNSSLWMGEVRGGYAWELIDRLSLTAWFGIIKVLSNDVQLKTGLAAFEASAAGSALLRSTESELESIINRYGISPILGLSVAYMF